MVAWFWVTMPSEEERAAQMRERAIQDSLAQVEALRQDSISATQPSVQAEQEINQQLRETNNPSNQPAVPSGIFASSKVTEEQFLTVETPLFKAVFSNKGAGPVSLTFKEYNNWAGKPHQLISDTTKSAYNFGFLTSENYNVDTQQLLFTQLTPETHLTLEKGQNKEVRYALELADGRQIVYTYTINADNYQIDLDVQFIGLSDYIVGRTVDFGWTSPLNSSELDTKQEGMETAAYIYAGDELEKFKLDKPGREENTINGTIDWTATKTKFFTQLIKPLVPTESATLTGEMTGEADAPNTQHNYTTSISSDIPDDGILSYKMYIGPLKYYDIRNIDEHAYDMVELSYGWLRWFSDPFVRFLVIPFFTFFGQFISNYGVLIIIFAATVKLILSPLTFKSYKSMAAMSELQPQLKEIQEKYKDNPQKQQQETMKLYKKEKVNPLGGCLPNLLQFPILITLWRFFQHSILLRQESFLWASDLSAPDYILDLPFSIPFLGDQLAGFVLLMSATMVIQSRVSGGMSGSGGSNPMAQQMKVLQYIFPVMLLFIFNNFAAGLSLYYLIFNALSIIQQIYIKRKLHAEKEAKKATS